MNEFKEKAHELCMKKNDMITDELNSRSLKIWLDSYEAAKHLKISVPTLRNLTSNGKIPYYKFGRRNRYLLAELNSLIESNKRGNLWL